MKYRQCFLRKELTPTSYHQQVSYIPEEHAVVGKKLQLKEHGEWVGGWVVLTAGELSEGKWVETGAHNSDSIWAPSAEITSRGNK